MTAPLIIVQGVRRQWADVPTIRTAEDWRKRFDSEPPAWFTEPQRSPLFVLVEAEAAERDRVLKQARARMDADLATFLQPTKENPMPKRQSSSKASTIAGRVQAAMRQDAKRRKELGMTHVEPPVGRFINATELKTLAASVLNQDETKGQAPKKRKAKGR